MQADMVSQKDIDMENVAMIMIRRMLIVALVVLSVTGGHTYGQEVSVNEFTGTLSASVPVVVVPGPGGSGYAISLQYNSDVRPEDEASIVGYGWNMTVPAITRSRRGYPDDHNGVRYNFRNPTYKTNTTWSLNIPAGAEVFGIDALPMSGSIAVTHNNYTGLDITSDVSLGYRIGNYGGLSLGTNSKGEHRFGLQSGLWSFEHSKGSTRISVKSATTTGATLTLVDGTPALNVGVGYTLSSVWRDHDPFGGAYVPVEGQSTHYEGVLIAGSIVAGQQGGVNLAHREVRSTDASHNVYGYLYCADRGYDSNKKGVLDYSVEKTRPFDDDQSRNLGMPVPDNDVFAVSVNGIAGAFRLHHWSPLQVRPPEHNSHIPHSLRKASVSTSGSVGTAISIADNPGTDIGIGFDGGGSESLIAQAQPTVECKPWQWRYIGEMSDDVRYSRDTSIITPHVDAGLERGTIHPLNRGAGLRSNNLITHKTYAQLRAEKASGPRSAFLADRVSDPYTVPGSGVATGSGFKHTPDDSTIAEFVVVGADGRTYWFSDAVYSWGERSATSTIRRETAERRQLLANRRIVYRGAGDDGLDAGSLTDDQLYTMERIVETASPYATAFLLSAVLEPDYVDVTGDGPTEDDLGGYTVFNYETVHEAFRSRSPYSGYWYSTGSLASLDDDQVTYSTSIAQVKVLKEIRTRSHRAVFTYAGTEGENLRLDAIAAPDGTAAGFKGAAGTHRMPYLKKAEVYRRGIGTEDQTLLSTQHFQYDFSLVPNCPSCSADYGRLTLKRTWTEHRDVKESRIHPTTFRYDYPVVSSTSGTNNIDDAGLASWQSDSIPQAIAGKNQNPSYDAQRIDGWGFYRKAQDNNLNRVYDHTPDQKLEDLDPAAYRLKQVIHPSGSRTIIQYEPHRYGHVQDKRAMMMVPLHATSTEESDTEIPRSNEYQLNPDVVTPLTSYERSELKNMIIALRADKRRMYHRLAYDFTMQRVPNLTRDAYVRGYSHIGYVGDGVEAGTITVELDDGSGPDMIPGGFTTIAGYNIKHKDEPRSLALQFLSDGLLGKGPVAMPMDVLDVATELLNIVIRPLTFFSNDLLSRVDDRVSLLPEQSYLRVPWPRDKIGGGVRVRKVVTISPASGLGDDVASMVGQRYEYSNGVATNEPPTMREQNAVVDIVASDIPNDDGRTCGEQEIAQAEGPFAETLMPSAKIGYGSVRIVSLNPNKSRPGFVAKKFMTARDRPSVAVYKSRLQTRLPEPTIDLSVWSETEKWHPIATQGYSVVIADVHGLPVSVEHLAGTPGGTAARVSGTYYRYNSPTAPVGVYDTLGIPLTMEHRGRSQDIIYEARKYYERFNSSYLYTVLSWAPLAGNIVPKIYNKDQSLTTRVATKITAYVPNLAGIDTYGDGITNRTWIVAYDKVTGSQAITSSFDEYDGIARLGGGTQNGAITTVVSPACRHYPQLGPRSEAEGYTYHDAFNDTENPPYGHMLVWGEGTPSACTLRLEMYGPESLRQRERKARHAFQRMSAGDVVALYSGTAGTIYAGMMTISNTLIVNTNVYLIGTATLLSGVDVDLISGLKVLKSAKQNQLTLPGTRLTLYGVSPFSLLAPALAHYERQKAADGLTELGNLARATAPFVWKVGLEHQHELAINPDVHPVPSDPMPESVAEDTYMCGGKDMDKYVRWMSYSNPNMTLGWKQLSTSTPCSPPAEAWVQVTAGTTIDAKMDIRHSTWGQFVVTPQGYLSYGNIPGLMGRYPAPGSNDKLLFDLRNATPQTVPTVDTVHVPVTFGNGVPGAPTSVLAASAVVYVPSQPNGAPIARIRPATSYTYVSETVVDAATPGDATYDNAGTFALDAMWSSWGNTSLTTLSAGGGWVRGTAVTQYDKHGAPTEMRDAIDVPSYVERTDNGRRIRASVAGASAGQVWSEDFETTSSGISALRAHTGKRSSSDIPFGAPVVIDLDAHPVGRPYVLSLWMYRATTDPYATNDVSVNYGSGSQAIATTDIIASVDGWELVEMTLPDGAEPSSLQLSTAKSYDIHIDDILIRPFESVAGRLIVDNTGEVRASLDDRGFATIAQTDDCGVPHRVVAEYITGWHTVSDQHGYMPGVQRQQSMPTGGAYTSLAYDVVTPPYIIASPDAFQQSLRKGILPEGTMPDILHNSNKGLNATFDVIDVNVSPDGRTIKAFGRDVETPASTTSKDDK